jgi:hypothetical protein
MPAWRVTYLPDSTAVARRRSTVTVEDSESQSLDTFVKRLSEGALGAEWTRGRVIQSVEALDAYKRRHRKVALTALTAAIVVGGIVLVGFVVPIPHSWSFTIYASGACPNGCGNQMVYQSFPNGTQVTGTWSAPHPLSLIIQTAHGIVCPQGGFQSGPGDCSQIAGASGSFGFTSVGGTVSFVALSQVPENVSVSGSWSATMW